MTHDREEILVVGTPGRARGGDGPIRRRTSPRPLARARIQGFREDTRAARMRIADEAEARFGRKVAWGAAAATRRSSSPA